MKFMNMKRFGSIAMAGALALSLASPAFAASTQPKNSTIITGGYEDIPISVTVPTTGTAKINPYGLPVKMAKSDETTATISGQQITHEVLAVRNNGDVALDMSVKSFLVVPKGEVAITTAKDTGKGMKVDLQVAGLNDAKYAVSSADETLQDKLIDAFASPATWASAATVNAPAVAAGGDGTGVTVGTGNNVATLGAATVADGEVTYGKDSIALFRLKGDMAQEPVDNSSAENPWDSADGFTATVVFKFAPVPPSAGDANVTVAISNTTATATFNAGTSGLTAVAYAWSSGTPATATISGNTANATITDAGAGTGSTSVITVTVTLSNGATITGTATYTAP